MTRFPPSSLRALLLTGALAAAGCSLLQAKADPTRFYVLAPVPAATPPAASGVALGLGPIDLPRYLQQSQLATRVGPNEVRFSPFARWAGELPTQFGTTLADDLREFLGTDRLVLFPWYSGTPLDVVVEVDVLRFEPDVGGPVRLVARWRVKDGKATALLHAGDTDVTESVGDGSPDAVVAALSRALARLAQDVAAGVRATPQPRS